MKPNTLFRGVFRTTCSAFAVGLLAYGAQAGTNIFNFNTDPSGYLSINRGGDSGTLSALAGAWFANGGSSLETGIVDQSTNGYLAITQTTSDPIYTQHGMHSAIVFDDFDNGLVVAGFTFTCDVRIGGGSATPADGFSLNFARNSDPALFGGTFGSGPDGNPANALEEGTTTGLVISFDAFSNSGLDTIGLTIKVDNVVLTNIAMPVLNGNCGDIASLQTGPNSAGTTNLCWQPLYVNLGTDGKLSVRYKNTTLLTNFVSSFVPSPGRLVLAGRTGGSWQEQDVDNIRIVTIAPGTPVVAPTAGNANGFRLNILDSGFATPDTNTISITLDGTPATITAVTQTGFPGGGTGVTTVGYRDTGLLLLPGSTHTNTIHFTGSTFNGAVDTTNVFTIPAYAFLASAQQAPGAVNTGLSGFVGRVNQLPVPRYPSTTSLIGIERQLADGFIDPDTGLPYTSIASVSTFTNSVINWYQDALFGGTSGFFNYGSTPPSDQPDDPIPGIDFNVSGESDNVASEVITVLELPVGAYELGVNHDDGFKLSVGAEPRDAFKATVLASSAASTDTSPIDIVVTNAGMYPFRLAWGEASGNALLEFYLIDLTTGQRVLINNRTNPVHIAAYADASALSQPYVRSAIPAPGEIGVNPAQSVVVKLEDGTAGTIINNSISLKVNGSGTPLIGKSGGETTVTLANPVSSGSVANVSLVYSTTLGGPYTNNWTYTLSYYGQDLVFLPLNEGSGNSVTDTVWGLTGTFTSGTAAWTNSPSGQPNDYALYFDTNTTRRLTIIDTNHVINLGASTAGTNGDYTVQCWVRIPTGFEPAARMVVFQYEGLPGLSFSINTGRTLHTTTFTLNDINSAAVVMNDNQWHHVAAVHENGVRVLFYIDGRLVSGVPYTRGLGVRTTYALTVGGAAGTANPFVGSVDRIRMTKGALKPNQFDLPIIPAPDTTPGDITSGLLAHLALDEMDSLTAADKSGKGHNGTLVNFSDSVSEWMASRVGGGLNVNPASFEQQHVEIPEDGTLNFTNGVFTIAGWLKAQPLSQLSGSGFIAKGTGGGGEQFDIDILAATGTGGNGGAVRFFVRNSAGTVTSIQSLGNNTNTVNGNWLHVAAVCDIQHPINGLQLYFNGLLAVVANAPASILSSTHAISVGAREASASSGYTLMMNNSLLDDIRVYKRALTSKDVATLYAEADAVRLSLLGSGVNRTLSWPAYLGSYVPQSTILLQPANTLWTDLGGTPALNGYFYTLPVSIQPGMKYYRLRANP